MSRRLLRPVKQFLCADPCLTVQVRDKRFTADVLFAASQRSMARWDAMGTAAKHGIATHWSVDPTYFAPFKPDHAALWRLFAAESIKSTKSLKRSSVAMPTPISLTPTRAPAVRRRPII